MIDYNLSTCHITFSARFQYRSDGGVQMHTHDSDYQIQVIYGGSATETINDIDFPVQEGDVVFIANKDRHAFSAGKEGLKSLELKFTTGQNMDFSRFKQKFQDSNHCLYNLFSRLVVEGLRKGLGYRSLCDALLVEILVNIDRICTYGTIEIPQSPSTSPFTCEGQASNIITEINTYIYRNLNKNFSLSMLAAGCGYNRDYIYRTIHKEFGVSAVQYINIIRFDQAKHLIEHSELSLSEIAWNLGFESIQYFSRFFKKHAGESPSAYSEKVRNTVRNEF